MEKSQELLSKTTIYAKYARYSDEKKTREEWKDICERYRKMLCDKYPQLEDEINTNMQFVLNKDILMSMRMAQFSGVAVLKNESRGYNCAYLPVTDLAAFSEAMFLLLGGTGVGFSVQQHHIEELPAINKASDSQKYLVGDSIEGWADAVKALINSYFGGKETRPIFDFSDIREKGERLITAGGRAPGPEPLRICLYRIEKLLSSKKQGERLKAIEAHDIMCHIADAVLAGGIRRAALISLFSNDDEEMLHAKSGEWYNDAPWRARSNNSAVFDRAAMTSEDFFKAWKRTKDSQSGEPGIYFTNDKDWGTNPCCEIALRPYQFCNLTEINAGTITTQEGLDKAAEVASFFGTLQAGFSDFHYLRRIWKSTTELDRLVGVGITGICNGGILPLDLQQAADVAKKENERIADIIHINRASRVTTIKPSGTTSCVLGTSSGIHAWHSKYYIRNIQCKVDDQLYTFFNTHYPKLVKIMDWDSNSAVIGFPQKAPDNAILREDENALQMLERVERFNREWVRAGHRTGSNTNNVSATVYIDSDKEYKYNDHEGVYEEIVIPGVLGIDEWEVVGKWMWYNSNSFNGLSVLPYNGGIYPDAPFQEVTEEEYYKRLANVPEDIDFTRIIEEEDQTDLSGEAACAGGACEI